MVPSHAEAIHFRETLSVAAVNGNVVTYAGKVDHFGKVTADLTIVDNIHDPFAKYFANGDTAFGYVTHSQPGNPNDTHGTITFLGGTGDFLGVTGVCTYVINGTTVNVNGTLTQSIPGETQDHDPATVPFKVKGSGPVPLGLSFAPGVPAEHDATGKASHVGKYDGTGTFTLDEYLTPTDPRKDPNALFAATFHSPTSFTFTDKKGDSLAFFYGMSSPGVVNVYDVGNGKVVGVFLAEFTFDPASSTGKFDEKYAAGTFTMLATSEPFSATPVLRDIGGQLLPFTEAFDYSWAGQGTLTKKAK